MGALGAGLRQERLDKSAPASDFGAFTELSLQSRILRRRVVRSRTSPRRKPGTIQRELRLDRTGAQAKEAGMPH